MLFFVALSRECLSPHILPLSRRPHNFSPIVSSLPLVLWNVVWYWTFISTSYLSNSLTLTFEFWQIYLLTLLQFHCKRQKTKGKQDKKDKDKDKRQARGKTHASLIWTTQTHTRFTYMNTQRHGSLWRLITHTSSSFSSSPLHENGHIHYSARDN